MKIIGLIGSARKRGNTEIMVKEILRAAQEQGATVESLRLTDYHIQPCTGCMSCMIKKQGCPIPDDAHRIFDTMMASDGIVVGAPVYFLGVSGIIKILIDRGFPFSSPPHMPFRGKMGVTCAVAGVPRWEQFALMELYLLFSSLGISLIDQVIAYAQGPGEVVLNNDSLLRARQAGRGLAHALQSNSPHYQGVPGVCPVCHNHLFMLSPKEKTVECPMCLIRGEVKRNDDGTLRIAFSDIHHHRWEEGERKAHIEQRILPSFQRYRENCKTILKKIKDARLESL